MWPPPQFYYIDICNIILTDNSFDIASYVEDKTPYIDSSTKDLVKSKLEICYTNFFR